VAVFALPPPLTTTAAPIPRSRRHRPNHNSTKGPITVNGTANKVATLVRDNLPNFNGKAQLYRLSPPLGDIEYVVVSAVVAYSGPETYIFPADESGEVTGWCELHGSFRGELDHAAALEGAGYEVQS
jgi:hypothetical protein